MPALLQIDRTLPFNPRYFVATQHVVVEPHENDVRSHALTTLDPARIELRICLKPGESRITAEKNLCRQRRKGRVCLDAAIFTAFQDNECAIPKEWRMRTNGFITDIIFAGTILQDEHSRRYALMMSFYEGRWKRDIFGLWQRIESHCLFAVLPN